MIGCEEEYAKGDYRLIFPQPRCFTRPDGTSTGPLIKVWLIKGERLVLEIEQDFMEFRNNREAVMTRISEQVNIAMERDQAQG